MSICISKALELVQSVLESENIPVKDNSIIDNVINWYNNTDITEPKEIAAAVLSYGNFRADISYDQIKLLASLIFGTTEEVLEKYKSSDEELNIPPEIDNISCEELAEVSYEIDWR